MSIVNDFRKPTVTRHYASHQDGAPILEARGLTLRYESGLALDDVSFTLHTGERVAVVGPNGAGKSTLFKVIAGVLTPERGEARISGQGPGGHICIAYLAQRSLVDWTFPVTVEDVVMMGRVSKIGLLRWPRREDWQAVRHSLEVVNLSAFSRRQIGELSGGQQQRMFIARALAQEAELLLMDEPLTGLDAASEESIFQILDLLRQSGVTVMVSTHDLDQAAARFDRVMLLNRRLVGFGAPQDVFQPETLMQAYGGHLHLLPDPRGMLAVGDSCCDEGQD